MGALALKAGKPFNLVTLRVPFGLADFALDNIVATTIPSLAVIHTTTNTVEVSWPFPT